MLYTTASTLLAILAYLDPTTTPKIAYNDDSLVIPLIKKLREAVGEKDGSQEVHLCFRENEKSLQEQFTGVCKNIKSIFTALSTTL